METDEIVIFETTTTTQPEDIREDGSIRLLEHLINKDKQMKVWVHSNEMCEHSRPHVHASYDHYEYQISIDDSIEILKGNGPDRYGRFLIKNYSTPYWIQRFRKAWNGIISNYKFEETKEGLVPPHD